MSRAGCPHGHRAPNAVVPLNQIEIMKTEKPVICKTCGATIDPLAVFPGGICLACHEKKFDAQVRANGGRLPVPDFSQIFSRKKVN